MFPVAIRRDVVALLCIKAAALTLIYFLFFAPSAHPAPGDGAVRTHLLGRAS